MENCEIGQLEIRDGQIGKLEIVKTKFDRLDLSRTMATEYALDASGEMAATTRQQALKALAGVAAALLTYNRCW
ncbi:MAG: hypothetical protein LBT81_01750 [Helicobacteraceae bacterium]|nr:hypothetical protein [Helicobacteraceae bacterium]